MKQNPFFKKTLYAAAIMAVFLQPQTCLSADADEDFTENYEGFKTYMAEYHAKAVALGKAEEQPRIRELEQINRRLESSNRQQQQQIATLTAQLQEAQPALKMQAAADRQAVISRVAMLGQDYRDPAVLARHAQDMGINLSE
jgi:hypothetical protein